MAKQTLTQAELDQIEEMVFDALNWTEGDYEIENDGQLENDGQPDEYTEWQDFMGGDDWDQGQYDTDCDY